MLHDAETPDDLALFRRMTGRNYAAVRGEIIGRFAYLVKITAERIVPTLPPSVERDDMISAGSIGLIKAVDTFDAARGVQFKTYAITLIRGKILEELREQDWAPRSIRGHIKNLQKVLPYLEGKAGYRPTEPEIARALGMTEDQYLAMLSAVSRASLISLDHVLCGQVADRSGEIVRVADTLADEQVNVAGDAEADAQSQALSAALGLLPERERLVLALYYTEGMTFREIGKILTLSESRAYQLHGQAVVRLRVSLQPNTMLFCEE